MNLHDDLSVFLTNATTDDDQRDEVLQLFPLDRLRHLDRDSAIRCQSLLGHGDQFGVWSTPQELVGRRISPSLANLRFRNRLIAKLPDGIQNSERLELLLDDAVLWMTRYALLLRLGPSAMKVAKERPLDPTTILSKLDQIVPTILGKAIQFQLEGPAFNEAKLIGCLTHDDLASLRKTRQVSDELKRMLMFKEMGFWSDAPEKANIKKPTSPKGESSLPLGEYISIPYPAIPDDYLAEMGPRVLWFVQDLGPNLINLLKDIPELFGDMKSLTVAQSIAYARKVCLKRYFEDTEWCDRAGQPITKPPFYFKIGTKRGRWKQSSSDPYAWPPVNWEQVKTLSVTLQSAHLWIALLAMAGRMSEIRALPRDCIEFARDGETYVNGKTYKLSANFAGTKRQWPAPEILTDALAQQLKLIRAWEQITQFMKIGDMDDEKLFVEGNHLWASLGTGRDTDPEEELAAVNTALRTLSMRLDMTPKPGGKNLHAHRFRKTIARLAALAIVDSPRVLMKLLGHRDITMTLHYILTDKALQKEIDQIARELRIMRCQEVVEDIHAALRTPGVQAFGGYGGGAAPLIAEAVKAEEEELHRHGQQWDVDSAHEMAVILTNNGQYFRVSRPGVICTKESREAGPCNCRSECPNRIEEKTARRDIIELIPILVEEGRRAVDDNQLLVAANIVQQLDEELERFEDIGAEWGIKPEVIALREAVEEQ